MLKFPPGKDGNDKKLPSFSINPTEPYHIKDCLNTLSSIVSVNPSILNEDNESVNNLEKTFEKTRLFL